MSPVYYISPFNVLEVTFLSFPSCPRSKIYKAHENKSVHCLVEAGTVGKQ